LPDEKIPPEKTRKLPSRVSSVGVDGSSAVISLDHNSLRGLEDRFLAIQHGLTDLATLE
jgi:hypothetical protein